MKYPKAFEKYWGRAYRQANCVYGPRAEQLAFKAWKAGRRHEKAQHKELTEDAW